MTDIRLQFPIFNSNSTKVKKINQLPTNNLFNNHQRRNLPTSSDATLPIITLSAFSNFEQKFIRMATKNTSMISSNHTPTDFPMNKIQSQNKRNLNRSNLPKSSLSYPTTITRPINSHHSNNTRRLYIDNNTPMLAYRTISARIPNHSVPVQQQQQQQQQPTIPSRPNTQYGHFLAYLRRQSLARLRRKQQLEEGHTDHIETTITLNLNKQPSPRVFQSISHYSLGSSNMDISSIPLMSITAKQPIRPSSLYRPLQRSMTTYRQTPSPTLKNPIDNHVLVSSSLLVTPRNSVADDATMSPVIDPYEFHLNDDSLHYRYTSNQRHVLSSAV